MLNSKMLNFNTFVEKPEVLQPSSNLVWGKQINHLNSTFSVTFLVAFTAEIDYRGKFHLFFFSMPYYLKLLYFFRFTNSYWLCTV